MTAVYPDAREPLEHLAAEASPERGPPGRAVGQVGFVRRLAEGELPNGLDDNGDGSVDVVSFYEGGKLTRRQISDPDAVSM